MYLTIACPTNHCNRFGVDEMVKLATKSFRHSIRGTGYYRTYALSKYGGRNTLAGVAAIFIILVMGPLPAVFGGFSGTSTLAQFERSTSTGCNALGSDVQAIFEKDQNSGTFAINEDGSQSINKTTGANNTQNDGSGDFKFIEWAQDSNYQYPTGTWPAPAVYASAAFRDYKLYNVTMEVSQPANGFSAIPVYFGIGSSASYSSVNWASPSVGGGVIPNFNITIKQTSTTITAYYSIYGSSPTPLFQQHLTWTYADPPNSNAPPYAIYGTSAQINGLEDEGYATVSSGTDFQIDSVITPYTATDFTNQSTVYSTSAAGGYYLTGCHYNVTTHADDEGGNAEYAYGGTGTDSAYNEAYQYVKVSAPSTTSITIDSVNSGDTPITGYYTVLYDQNGTTGLQDGFTPVTFTDLYVQGVYVVQPQDYGGCTFSHWQDTGSTTRGRVVTAHGQTLTAVYGVTPGYASCP
jgi:hypothetical protein